MLYADAQVISRKKVWRPVKIVAADKGNAYDGRKIQKF